MSSNSPESDNANKKHSEGVVGASEKCAVGTKKAKQIKKEDEMAERMARSLATTAAPTPKNSVLMKSSGLHNDLPVSCPFSGQGMLTSMMQFMSNSAIAEMQQ